MIYCVEDDQSIRDLMVYTLKTAGFEAKGMESGQLLYQAIAEQIPDLILLDIMLPGEDGIEILKTLRTNNTTSRIPVIMASAKGTEYDKVVGLDLGADDYLAKPFGMMEMVSRVRAVLRRVNTSEEKAEQETLRNGDLEMNIPDHEVIAEGSQVLLTLKEFDLLQLLMSNQGRVFSREQILNRVWGFDFAGESRTVDVHMGTLRTKLGRCGSYITTVRGVGYKMEKQR